MSGSLIFLLHAHLPYVRQPSDRSSIEELWFLEAMWETYLPLVKLVRQHPVAGLTISISPALAEMMRDPLMNKKFMAHMEALRKLAESEVKRTRGTEYEDAAVMCRNKIDDAYDQYEKCNRDVLGMFSDFMRSGSVEIVASAATHAFLPAYKSVPDAVKLQVGLGIKYFEKIFSRRPKGFWLPECGYCEGIDQVLHDAGIEYFFTESHGLINGNPVPEYSVHRPVRTPCGIAVFGRDAEISNKIWSAESGYPGAAEYRDFYRDIGFDLPESYLQRFLHDFGSRVFSGLKYHSVGNDRDNKRPYNRLQAMERVETDAADFINQVKNRFRELSGYCDNPVIVAAFDAELFGHWWSEGIDWLGRIIDESQNNGSDIKLETASANLSAHRNKMQTITLSASSWGEGSYSSSWIFSGSSRFYNNLLKQPEMLNQMIGVADMHCECSTRAVMQALREMLLSQSSDWMFLIHKNRAGAYAEKRLVQHIKNFDSIYWQVVQNCIDELVIDTLEKDCGFLCGWTIQDLRSIKCFS